MDGNLIAQQARRTFWCCRDIGVEGGQAFELLMGLVQEVGQELLRVLLLTQP